MSSNYDYYEETFARLTPEEKREFAAQRLNRQRAIALGYTLSGVPGSPEQEAYDEVMSRNLIQSRGMDAPDSQAAPVRLLEDRSD
jgi:hypothetical protein